MAKFNLSKVAANPDYKNYNKMLEEQVKEQGLVDNDPKNINLKLPVKDKDNTLLIEGQIDKIRKGKDTGVIIETNLETVPVIGKRNYEWDTTVLPINSETEKYHQEHLKAFKAAEERGKKDTTFWDKYLGVEMKETGGEKTKVNKNIEENSQLQNAPDRFKNLNDVTKVKLRKMVDASLKDADAMLFHIHANAEKEGRDLSYNEKQMVVDINSGKEGLLSKADSIIRK